MAVHHFSAIADAKRIVGVGLVKQQSKIIKTATHTSGSMRKYYIIDIIQRISRTRTSEFDLLRMLRLKLKRHFLEPPENNFDNVSFNYKASQ
jgi:hypothetical protein